MGPRQGLDGCRQVPRRITEVADIDEALARVEASGGKLVGEKLAIPSVGCQAYCTDLDGNVLGLHQRDENASM